jgi:hypothetical protein
MWLFSLVLVLPLLIGVASTSKRVYGFLIGRGVSKNNALTASVVGLIMLAGVMSSPLFLGVLPVRFLAGATYLYFLFVGGKSIVEFFTGGSSAKEEHSDAPAPTPSKPAPEADHDCGCGGDGKHDAAETDAGAKNDGDTAGGAAPDAPPAPKPPRRSPADARAEIERRLREREGRGEGDQS